jgi:hypothetical protein
MGKLPGDACPYPRPFPEDFRDCPAFERTTSRPVGSPEAQTNTVVSCANLTVGTFWDGTTHHYGQCRLGDRVARLALLRTQIEDSETYVNWQLGSDDIDHLPPPILPPR